MLRDFFPYTDEGANIYGGFLFDITLFCRSFPCGNSIEEMLVLVNEFLSKNGYKTILASDLTKENEYTYRQHPVSLSPNGYQVEMDLFIQREVFSNPQTTFIINEIKKFRDERDWEQFHDPKDLAIAMSVESNELLEQFLWKSSKVANLNKIKEELADVFSYAFLLADKLNLDVEEIILQKIKKNAEKYPIDKSKGTAKKYDEL
jgi:NTP pyrophosphatase (non-canonical NTP hydrolase)